MTIIKVLREVDASNISSAPCKQEQDNLLSWELEPHIGSQWSFIEEFEDQVCASKDFYNLAISFEMTIDESMATCKHKSSNSIIPFKNGVRLLNVVKNGPNGP